MIQIIEDDLVACRIIAGLLKHLRYPYCEAHTGAEALQQFRTRPIDLIIADMVLPDAHGLDLLAEKHRLPYLRDIPVICCTAHADIDTVERAIGLGAVDFIKKPPALQVLADRIARAMERAPVRWERASGTGRQHPSGQRPQAMLAIAQDVLRELDSALEAVAATDADRREELTAVVARARGAAHNVGALRTVEILRRLWDAPGSPRDPATMRAALAIEIAAFDEAIAVEGELRAAVG